MGLSIEATTDPDSTEFRQAMHLYRRTMPKPLRDPDWEVTERIADATDPYCLIVARAADTVVGYAIGEYLPAENLGFLAYLGTDPAVRGRGIGAALYEAFLTRIVEDALRLSGLVPHGLVLEAEKPDVWASPAEAALCARRLRFYARLGAHPIEDLDFFQPRTRSQDVRSMHLLYHAIGREAPSQQRRESLARVVYRRVYGLCGPPAPAAQAV